MTDAPETYKTEESTLLTSEEIEERNKQLARRNAILLELAMASLQGLTSLELIHYTHGYDETSETAWKQAESMLNEGIMRGYIDCPAVDDTEDK